MPINRIMNKQNVSHPNGDSARERNEALIHATAWMHLDTLCRVKETAQEHVARDFMPMKCPERGSLCKQKVDYWLPQASRARRTEGRG